MHVDKKTWNVFLEIIINGDSDLAKKILLTGIDLSSCDDEGRTLLMHAAMGRYVDIVMLLLRHDASINAQDVYGYTPLMLAVLHDRLASVELLLHAGAEKHIKDLMGRTAMDIAIAEGGLYRNEIIDALYYDPDNQTPCCSGH